MKIHIVEEIYEFDGQVDTRCEAFDTLEKAKECKENWSDNNFVDDIKRDIEYGKLDSHIENDDTYFYAYDSINFEAQTITIYEKDLL